MSILAALVVAWSCAALAALACGLRVPLPGARSSGRRARRSGRATWLRQAGLAVAPLQFVAASAGAALVVLGVLSLLVGPVVALVPAIAAAATPYAFYRRRRERRLGEVQAAWPDGLRDLLVSLRAGRSIGQAIDDLAHHGPDALRSAFVRFPALRRSLGTTAALEAIREELADPVSDRVIEVLLVAAERGGTIVTTVIEELCEGTTADLKLAEELQTAMLESRLNARAVVAMPWLVLILLNVGNGPFRHFYRSPAGFVTVVAGAVLTLVGWSLIVRIGRLPAERRVLGDAS